MSKKLVNQLLSAALCLTTQLGLVQSSFASLNDVKPSDATEKRYIRVFVFESKLANQMKATFKLCFINEPLSKCEPIGKKGGYTLEALEDERGEQKWKLGVAIGADALILTAAAFGGAGLGSLFAGGSAMVVTPAVVTVAQSAAITKAMIAGCASATTISAAVLYLVDNLNPFERYKKIEALSDSVIHDQDVKIDEEMSTYIERLKSVLENIE